MNPIETIWEFVVSELQGTEFCAPVVVSACILFVIFGVWRRFGRWRYRVAAAVMAVGLVVIAWNFFMQWNYCVLYFLAGFLILLPFVCFLILFLWNKHRLGEIRESCEQQSYIEALDLLNAIKFEWLTDKQLCDYQKRRFFLLVKLGSLRKARLYLDEIELKENSFYHFALHILAFASGNMETFFHEIHVAEDSSDLKNDPFLKFQIITNLGVAYAAKGNYHLADEYFRKAIAFYDNQKLQDEELLGIFYYNYAFNCLRLSPNTADWQTVLDECQSRLDMKKTNAQICMLNLRLELMRQAKAPREVIDKLLQEALCKIAGCKLPLKNQVFFASSAARVAWAAQVNPIPFLEILNNNLFIIEDLPPNQRYHIYSELDILFRDLHGPINDPFAALRDRTASYLRAEAENDLRQWQKELPGEAVLARCECLKKMAVLYRGQTPYNRERIISFQRDASRLYHDNMLYLDELHIHQDIIDELLDEHNRDADYRPTCVKEIREHLLAAEKMLSQVSGHPALVEAYIRLGCYWIELDDYEKSINYARLFMSTNISIQNFAPWLRRYYAILLLYMRVILFDQAIKKAAADKRLHSFCKDIRDWFSTYPNHDGKLETMLLGRFLSVSVGKEKIWIPSDASNPQGHTWLWIPDLELNIDLTYSQFVDDEYCHCIFFHKDRHPFESGTSLALQIGQQKEALIFKGVICLQPDSGMNAEIKMFVDNIYDNICSYISQDCPAMEEIMQLLQEFMVPVPIQV